MKKPKWAKSLSAREIKHVAESSATGKASLRVAKLNAENPHCVECRCIGNTLKNAGVFK